MVEYFSSKRAISPILTTLLLIVIVVAASIAVYVWIQSYTGSQTSIADSFFVIENVNWDNAGNVGITVRNTGSTRLVIDNVYIDGLRHSVEQTVSAGDAETITIEYIWVSGQRYQLKVVDKSGLMTESTYKAPSTNWLIGWEKRVKITIDSNDINNSITDFPVLVHLSTSSGENSDDVSFIFDEVGSNSKKIAVTTADGTECYVEIEDWDSVIEQAWLWVKVPSLSNTSDRDLYLYYDSTHDDNIVHVGEPNSTPAENVWDSYFTLVTHMVDDPDNYHTRDSTLNDNDGTKEWPNAPSQADGKIGNAQDFNTIISDFVNCVTDSTLNILDTLTIEAWINPDQLSVTRQNSIVDRGMSYWFLVLVNQRLSFLRYNRGSFGLVLTDEIIPTGTYTHVAVGFDSYDPLEVKLYINGELSKEGSLDGLIDSSSSALLIGDRGPNVHYFDGVIDEVRISNTIRSSAWIKASYESQRDNLLSFGSEETT